MEMEMEMGWPRPRNFLLPAFGLAPRFMCRVVGSACDIKPGPSRRQTSSGYRTPETQKGGGDGWLGGQG